MREELIAWLYSLEGEARAAAIDALRKTGDEPAEDSDALAHVEMSYDGNVECDKLGLDREFFDPDGDLLDTLKDDIRRLKLFEERCNGVD